MSKKETNNKEPLKAFLQDRFEDYEHPVRDDLWSDIEQDLFETKKPLPRKKIFFISVAVAASLVLAFLIIPPFQNENAVVVDKTDAPASFETPSSVKETVLGGVIEASTPAEPVLLANASKVRRGKVAEVVNLDSLVVIGKTEAKVVRTYDVRDDSTTNNNKPKYTDLDLPKDEWIEPVAKKKSSKLSFALMAMGTPKEKNEFDNMRYYNAQQLDGLSSTSVKYDQPINIGFSVRKNISKRFSVETGLSYTYLSSREVEKYKTGEEHRNKIKLHYLGIPVKLNYTIFEDRRFALYATAGAMVEKSIAGSIETIRGQRSQKEDLSVSELQWSLLGAVGAQYKLTKNWSVFVDPGIGYFFDDKSDVATIRKDKSLVFNIQGGVRFTY